MGIVYPNGSVEVSVAGGLNLSVFSEGVAEIYYKQGAGNIPPIFYYSQTVTNDQVLIDPASGVDYVRIDAGASPVYYETGATPVAAAAVPAVLTTGAPSGLVRAAFGIKQGAPTAKTVSATLTAAELLTRIITVNQAAAGASAQQLPLASAMDTALSDFVAGDAFDFSVINTSTVDAEDASITTNTGWTLVGNMDVPAYSAAGSLNSSGLFRARKTGTAAWTLYRIG